MTPTNVNPFVVLESSRSGAEGPGNRQQTHAQRDEDRTDLNGPQDAVLGPSHRPLNGQAVHELHAGFGLQEFAEILDGANAVEEPAIEVGGQLEMKPPLPAIHHDPDDEPDCDEQRRHDDDFGVHARSP